MIFAEYFLRSVVLLLIITVSICSFNVNAQEIPIKIHGEKVKPYLDDEKEMGSKPYLGEGDIIIPGGMAMPLTYRRSENGIPDLLVTYTFSIKDSLLNSIEYEWDMNNFGPKYKPQSLKIQQAFIKKYLSLAEQLTMKVGKSKQKGDLNDLSKINGIDGLTRTDEWEPNDTTNIYMYSVFSNYQATAANAKSLPANRIRLSITKTEKPSPELSDEAISAAMKSYNQFISKLRAGNQEGAKAFLSSQIRNLLTEPAFNNLRAAIKPGDFKVFSQTLESIAGTNYLVIQFCYASAPEQPNDMVKVVFDKEHFIIGIQPLVRKKEQ
ncbi:hypothetical protein ACSBL2_15480 [Pedobacter sp. AW31-3R]|uniref:hypothetical protein n=1 Tax=Pedobacter sp. AW31-3R TaxID=3445781 RepID=UPI003FA11763